MASTILVNTINTQSGSTITIPAGKTLAVTDAGALTIGGTAITTGAHATATSSTNPTTITSGNITGKSTYALIFDAGAGTSTEFVVNLPAPADFATTVITVKANTTMGTGNKITIKDSGGTEVYTLYHVNDHCTFVSDGTNTIRTGDEWVTVRGEVALTAALVVGTGAVTDLFDAAGGNYAEEEDIGGCWSTTTDDFTAPFAGEYILAGSATYNGYANAYQLQKNGTSIQALDGSGIPYGNGTFGVKSFVLAKNDVITWWGASTSGTPSFYGNASATVRRTTANWWCLRRY